MAQLMLLALGMLAAFILGMLSIIFLSNGSYVIGTIEGALALWSFCGSIYGAIKYR